MTKPTLFLAGRTVLNTRPASVFGSDDKLSVLLAGAGAQIVAHPVVQLLANPAEDELHRQLVESVFRTIVFVSPTGVRFLIDYLNRISLAPHQWSENRQIAAIGHGTEDALREFGLKTDLVPPVFKSLALARELIEWMPDPYLLIRADRGSNELAVALDSAGKTFIEAPVYVSRDLADANEGVLEMLAAGKIDWVTVSSSAIARSTCRLFGGLLRKVKIVCISESVGDVLAVYGYQDITVARSTTFAAMLDAMRRRERES